MAAHSGERAQRTGDFHCAKCSAVIHVTEGGKIPKCQTVNTELESRTGEPGNKSRALRVGSECYLASVLGRRALVASVQS